MQRSDRDPRAPTDAFRGGTTGGDRTGQPGVESALGRDRTRDGDLPAEMATNRGPAQAGYTPSSTGQSAGGGSNASGAGNVLDSAPLPVQQAADQAQQAVGAAVDLAQQQAAGLFGSQMEQVSGSLNAVSRAMHSVSEELRHQDQNLLAGFAEQAAQRAEHASGYLHGRQMDDLLSDAERFARRQPALFLGGAFALGLLAARFLKSSGRAQMGSSGAWNQTGGQGWSGAGYSAGTGYGSASYAGAGYASAGYGGSGAGYGSAGNGGSSYGTAGYGSTGYGAGYGSSPASTTPGATYPSAPTSGTGAGDVDRLR